jgi:D-amino-acid dehydrogenase
MTAPSTITLSRPGNVGIIGAGAVGLSCAFYLQRAGHQVDIFDFRNPGEGASFGNAGIIAVSEIFPVARASTLRQVPRMLLDPVGPLVIRWRYLPRLAPWLIEFLTTSRVSEVRRISLALSELTRPALAAWQAIARACGSEHCLIARGWLKLCATERDLAAAKQDADKQRDLGIDVEILGANEARALEPALAPVFAGAAFFPKAGNLTSPIAMTRSIAARLAQNGAKIERRKISRIEPTEGGAVLIDDAGGRSRHDWLVIAAGAWSRSLLRSLGLDVRLDTERGYHLMLPSPERTLTRAVSAPNPGYSLVQMEDGLRLTSGVEFAGLDAPPDFRRIRGLLAHVQKALPGVRTDVQSEWLGFRPSMPKSMPVIGALKRHPHVLLAFGHGHLGLTLGPITGEMIAAMIAGEDSPVDPSPFAPTRNVT